MNFSWQQLFFWLIFFELVFLFLLFGESFINWYLTGILAFFIWFNRKNFDFQQLSNSLKVIVGWGLFLVLLVTSGVFTHSWPLTLNALVFFMIAVSFFILGLSLKPKLRQLDHLLIGLLLTTLELCLLTAWFWLQPDFAKALPSMNLLFHTFGHNHLAAWLLLVFPFSWQLSQHWLVKSKFINLVLKIIPYGVMFFLLTSFGRVAVAIGFMELLAVAWFNGRFKNKKYWLVMLFFSLILLTKVSLSVAPWLIPNYQCPAKLMRQQLCKPVNLEQRPKYWLQAIDAIKTYPWFGYGPGTFSLISKKYQRLENESSAYAHNAWLQIMAELGLPGGLIFLGLMFYLLWLVVKKQNWSGKKFTLYHSLAIGVIAIYINVWFDFDWSFVGLFGMTLFLLGFLLNQSKNKFNHQSNLWLSRATVLFFYGLILSQLTLGILYVGVDSLIRIGQIKTAAQIFPYFASHFYLLADSDQLSLEQQEKIYQLYVNDPNLMSTKMFVNWSEDRKSAYYHQLFSINPWSALRADHLYPTKFSPIGWEARLDEQVDFIFRQTRGKTELVTNDLLNSLVAKNLILAERAIVDDNIAEAGNLYLRAYLLDPWALSNHQPFFLVRPLTDEQLADFLLPLNQVRADGFGNYQDDYAQQYLRLLLFNIDKKEYLVASSTTKRILAVADWRAWDVWYYASIKLGRNIESSLADGELETAQQGAWLWYQIWQQIPSPTDLDYDKCVNLAEILQKVSEASLERDQQDQAEYFQQASQAIFFKINN